MRFDWFAISEQGAHPHGNDDVALGVPDTGVFVVADGMGGRPGGAQASQIAATVFVQAVRRATVADRLKTEMLQGAVAEANTAVLAAAAADPALAGMGTTLTAAVLVQNYGRIVHVGDTRAYLFGRGWVQQLTEDHTLAAELLARRYLSEEGAMRFPHQNILSRAVGTRATIEADLLTLALEPDEALLLATDGLFKAVPPLSLAPLLTTADGADARTLCRTIVDAALNGAPDDNVTALVLRIVDV